MIVALYILIALMAVGTVLKLTDRPRRGADPAELPAPETVAEQSECCGLHLVCERDLEQPGESIEAEYFDDEELDTFAGRRSDQYSGAEKDLFRDVLYTLAPGEVAAWNRSMARRGIELPDDVRDEMLMLMAEARASQ